MTHGYQSAEPQPLRAPGDTHEPETTAEVVQAPAWQPFDWLLHGFSTRVGGVSSVYGGRTLNLGWTPEDPPENVVQNRLRFATTVAQTAHADVLAAPPLVGLRQIHSNLVRVIERDADGRLRAEESPSPLTGADSRPLLEGDGLMTDVPGILLAVGVADCVPVLIADVDRRAVAAFHAGWRGTLAGIVERGVRRMRLRYGSRRESLIAVVGPSIGPCCYVVGEQLRADFEKEFLYASALFTEVRGGEVRSAESARGHQSRLDLWEANRRQLLHAGLLPEAITVLGECTACSRSLGQRKYFSHRAESGVAGRGLGAIGIRAT